MTHPKLKGSACNTLDGPPAAPSTGRRLPGNRYLAACFVCGQQVPPGAGRMERVQGAWRVFH